MDNSPTAGLLAQGQRARPRCPGAPTRSSRSLPLKSSPRPAGAEQPTSHAPNLPLTGKFISEQEPSPIKWYQALDTTVAALDTA